MEVNESFSISDDLWDRIEAVLPQEASREKGGRPPMDPRQAMTAIFYVLRTGCQWKALPRSLGASSTVYGHFRSWVDAEVFLKLWENGLYEYDELKGIEWTWQSVDGCMTKAPLGGEAVGPNPTDRAKSGTKRSLLTDGAGAPLGIAVDGANRHDKRLLEPTLNAAVVPRPEPEDCPQHLCLDKGYDYNDIRDLLNESGYIPHIKSRGDEILDKNNIPDYRARRWVVERTHSWLNRYRRLLVRWEKRLDCYSAFLYFACAIAVLKTAGVFG